MNDFTTYILKNGTEEVQPLVKVTMMTLHKLANEYPLAAYDLVELCKSTQYKPFGGNNSILENYSLIINGEVPDSIKNIVLSAFEGEGINLKLTSPIKQATAGD